MTDSDRQDVTVRPARPEDAAAIAEIHVESWRAAYRGHMPDELLDSLSKAGREMTWHGELVDPAPHSEIFLAERDDLVGFSACGPSRDRELDGTQTGEIYAVYVAPGRWREGIGGALLEASLDFLGREGFEKATIWVLESNQRARDFYEWAGFRADGAEKTELHKGVQLEEVRYRGSIDRD